MYLALEVFQDLQRLEYRRCFQNPMILNFLKSASSSLNFFLKITILLYLVLQLFTRAKISIQHNFSKRGQSKEPTSEGIVEARGNF
jgi:hypothetical protein